MTFTEKLYYTYVGHRAETTGAPHDYPQFADLPDADRTQWAAVAGCARDELVRRSVSGMDFGNALDAIKAGKRVRRSGWNGKGMWLALTEGSERVVRDGKFNGAAAKLVEDEQPETVRIGAHIDMRAADGSLVIGWLASQTDMLAMDWEVVE